jgi:hypothetical protein
MRRPEINGTVHYCYRHTTLITVVRGTESSSLIAPCFHFRRQSSSATTVLHSVISLNASHYFESSPAKLVPLLTTATRTRTKA